MKLLLTSAGIKNQRLQQALVDLIGKPIAEATALCIPTACYANPRGIAGAWRFITGTSTTPMCELGWKSLGVLELSALPSIDPQIWLPQVQATDVLLVNGGDAALLSHWLRRSGLADLLPTWPGVYAGFSAGSMVLAPRIGREFVGWPSPGDDDATLGLVEFAIFPHLDHPDLPENTMADAERWAANLAGPAYAIDDDTAIQVTDDGIEVISAGSWRLFNA